MKLNSSAESLIEVLITIQIACEEEKLGAAGSYKSGDDHQLADKTLFKWNHPGDSAYFLDDLLVGEKTFYDCIFSRFS